MVDLRYCLPQRSLVQMMLLDVDACYHLGNISIPRHKLELGRSEVPPEIPKPCYSHLSFFSS